MARPDAVMISHPMLVPLETTLAPEGWTIVRRWEPEAVAAAADAIKAIIHVGDDPLAPDFLATLPNLGLIACISVGYNGVDVPAARAAGIEVTHAWGLNADDVADHTLGILISAWRGLSEGERLMREGRWTHEERLRPRPSLTGRKLGVVGLGAIGEAVAKRAEAFGMTVAWWGPREKPDAAWLRVATLDQLARESDILVVASRADESNRGLISQAVIEALGPQGLLVNVARGQLVDEDALIAALKDGRLGGAALDVFEQEPTPAARWADVPNVVLTPHSAGSTTSAVGRMVAACLDNVRSYMAGKGVLTPVRE